MAKREFLMLAHTFKSKKHGIGGWLYSEKLDGMRAYWDGGLTRGMLKSDVPWSNMLKDERYVNPTIATGLWSRYGNVIHAPARFLDAMPRIPLDGELYSYDLPRQDLMSIVKSLVPSEMDWRKVKYFVFDMPAYDRIFMDGVINTTNFKKKFVDIVKWIFEDTDITSSKYTPRKTTPFQSTYLLMQKYCISTKIIVHMQERLPFRNEEAIDFVNQYVDQISAVGGEGAILRKPESIWVPQRDHTLLKVKKTADMEGTVVGYVTGRKTELGSKLLGMMGALVLELPNGKRMELSGFTDEERQLIGVDACYDDSLSINATFWAEQHPEEYCPDWISAEHFPRGNTVTFKYRGLTKDKIPQEARYWRKREVE